ncbi:cell wall anchor protein [Phytomonospora sp. NPDC050363]|uniref:cell wall anchor protein n=1 Tax=Phytomonospora sp. NPDC050363 TaxID=3155642 RepID=UPI00340C4264
MPGRPSGRTLAILGAGASVLVAAAVAMSPSALADTAAARDAATWQAGEITAEGHIPTGWGTTDWGLTIDTLIALKATGVEKATADKITAALEERAWEYFSLDLWDTKGQRIAGAAAKVLYAATISDADPEAFGDYDMRQEVLDLVAGADKGPEEGRVKNKVTDGSDSSNTFDQSLAILGLAGSGDVPQSAVDFLIDQQCSEGGFRLYPYAFGGTTVNGDCDAQENPVLDPDSTGMAVQALLAAAGDGAEGAAAAAKKGGDWLKEIQRADGEFGGSGPTEASNANSTGLAGQALAATGHQAEADRAAAWVAARQITAADAGAASEDVGTIAYNDELLADAKANGLDPLQRDTWRRATPQALLVLAQVPLGEIGKTDPNPGGSDSPSPTDPTSSSPTATATPTPTDPASSAPVTTPATTTTVGVPPGPGGNGKLPLTGSSLLMFGGAALILLAGGAVLFLAARKRKGAQTS